MMQLRRYHEWQTSRRPWIDIIWNSATTASCCTKLWRRFQPRELTVMVVFEPSDLGTMTCAEELRGGVFGVKAAWTTRSGMWDLHDLELLITAIEGELAPKHRTWTQLSHGLSVISSGLLCRRFWDLVCDTSKAMCQTTCRTRSRASDLVVVAVCCPFSAGSVVVTYPCLEMWVQHGHSST